MSPLDHPLPCNPLKGRPQGHHSLNLRQFSQFSDKCVQAMDGRVYGTSQNCCSRASGANWGLISSVAQLRANFYCCTQFLLVGPMEANFFGLTLCSCIESSVTIQKTLEQKRTTITGRPTTLLIHVFYNKELQSNDTNVRNKIIVRPFVNLLTFFC